MIEREITDKLHFIYITDDGKLMTASFTVKNGRINRKLRIEIGQEGDRKIAIIRKKIGSSWIIQNKSIDTYESCVLSQLAGLFRDYREFAIALQYWSAGEKSRRKAPQR